MNRGPARHVTDIGLGAEPPVPTRLEYPLHTPVHEDGAKRLCQRRCRVVITRSPGWLSHPDLPESAEQCRHLPRGQDSTAGRPSAVSLRQGDNLNLLRSWRELGLTAAKVISQEHSHNQRRRGMLRPTPEIHPWLLRAGGCLMWASTAAAQKRFSVLRASRLNHLALIA